MYASISNKIQQEIISNYFLSHCFFKNSIWRLIHTRILSYGMSIVDLMASISRWKNLLYNICIRI